MFQKLKTLVTQSKTQINAFIVHQKTQRMYNKLLSKGFISDHVNPKTGNRTIFKIKDNVNSVTVFNQGVEQMRIKIGPHKNNVQTRATLRKRINNYGDYLNKDNSILKIY